MGVEAAESELAQVSVESGSEDTSSLLIDTENMKMNQGPGLSEPIKFGSHGLDELAKVETNNVLEANFPNGVVDEWPMPPQVHSFYIVKYRSYEDPKLKVKLEQADKDLQKKIQTRSQLVDKLRAKRSDRAEVSAQMRSLFVENKQFRSLMDEKKKEMEPLHEALGQLRTPNSTGRDRGAGLCSSEEELDGLIKSLNYRIAHESNTLTEEKQIMREIKQLEGTREKVTANAAMRAKIQESLGQKEVIQDQVKLMGADFVGVKNERLAVRAKLSQLEEERNAIDKEIGALESELTVMTQKRDEARQYLQNLKKQREEGNACYFQNRTLLNKAKDFAAKKDVEALQKICDTEVENFMSLWSSSKVLRDDYERRILPSLDFRQLSKDGRIRNPDEKSFLVREAVLPSETETAAKPKVKQVKEESVSLPKHDSGYIHKVPKEAKGKQTGLGSTSEPLDIEKESISGLEKQQKVPPPMEKEVDVAKLKEMKREEEMAKAKLALERKKKLAEKAAAKAAIKAQKEAEKKLKDREKKAKKKAGAAVPAPDTEEPTDEADAEVAEPEKPDEVVDAPVLPKSRDRKENTIRHRNRPKGQDSLSKLILKRKKSTNYWMWAAPAGIAMLVLLVIGYFYLMK